MDIDKDLLKQMFIEPHQVNSAVHLSELDRQYNDAVRQIQQEKQKRDNAIFQTAQASVEQKQLLESQLVEVKQQNAQLKENYNLLKELYEKTKQDAENNAQEARKSRIFGWVSFAVGTIIGLAGVVLGIIV